MIAIHPMRIHTQFVYNTAIFYRYLLAMMWFNPVVIRTSGNWSFALPQPYNFIN